MVIFRYANKNRKETLDLFHFYGCGRKGGIKLKLIQDYLSLCQAFSYANLTETISISMSQIANALYCTPRNAKIILTKMKEQGWIDFQSGRGRGHASRLTFLIPREDLLVAEAQERVQSGEVEEAFDLIQQYGEHTQARVRLLEWFSSYFGYDMDQTSWCERDILRLPISRVVNTLDPAYAFYALDSHLVTQIYDRLIEHQEETDTFVGQLAHTWEQEKDARVWNFYLRKGICFHHGKELTAEDVVGSFLRMKDHNLGQSWWMSKIEMIDALNRYTVRFHLKETNWAFLHFLSAPASSVVSQDENHEVEGLPWGTGPYRVKRWTPRRILLEAYDHHFQGRAWLDEIEMIYVEEWEATWGDSDNVLFVHTGEIESPTDLSMQSCHLTQGYYGTSVLSMNQDKEGPLQDIRFRKSLDLLINRSALIEDLGEPRICPSSGFHTVPYICPIESTWDHHKGVEVLQQSSYQGETLQLWIYQRHLPDARWIQEVLGKYGIRIEIVIVSWADLLLDTSMRQADLILFEAEAKRGSMKILEILQSRRSFLRNHLDPVQRNRIDQASSQLLATENVQDRVAIMERLEKDLLAEYAYLPIAYKYMRTTFHPSLQGVSVNSRGWIDFHRIWRKE